MVAYDTTEEYPTVSCPNCSSKNKEKLVFVKKFKTMNFFESASIKNAPIKNKLNL